MCLLSCFTILRNFKSERKESGKMVNVTYVAKSALFDLSFETSAKTFHKLTVSVSQKLEPHETSIEVNTKDLH